MAAKVTASLLTALALLGALGANFSTGAGIPSNPGKIYIVSYWDVQPPKALDPEGRYRQEVERIAADYCQSNPSVDLRLRWLDWVNAEEELAKALRDGNPPDIFADWRGLSYRDHILQLALGNWLPAEELEPVGKRLVYYEGEPWAWPRWYWPQGIVALGVKAPAGIEKGVAPWDWAGLRAWLEEEGVCLEVNDWDCNFIAQSLLASTGYGWGRWGGQELSEMAEQLESLRQEGLVSGKGRYLEGLQGRPVAGMSPAFMTWLAQQDEGKELVLLPLPSVGSRSCLPVSGTSLIQFRQARYKGDDHSRVVGETAAHLAREQGERLAPLFLGASAWRGSTSPPADQWGFLMALAAEKGVPSGAIDKAGRQREREKMLKAAPSVAAFWAGSLSPAELARELEDLQ